MATMKTAQKTLMSRVPVWALKSIHIALGERERGVSSLTPDRFSYSVKS
jgi:hypothetical protein